MQRLPGNFCTASKRLSSSQCSTLRSLPINLNCGDHIPNKPSPTATQCASVSQQAPSVASYRGPESFPDATLLSPPDANVEQHIDCDISEVMKLVTLLPPAVKQRLESDYRLADLLEVVIDLGRLPLARFPDTDVQLSESPITQDDLDHAVAACGEFGGDNRAGIDATLHRISAIRNRRGNIVGLTCRVGRAVKGSASMARDLALAGKSILFLGRPGVGKTTAIREISRVLADELHKRVVIVDTSNEIGGDGDIPHAAIGRARRLQVRDPSQQHVSMIEAVENHMPETIVIDEIGTSAEAMAARTIAQRGVQLIATAHGNELENVMKNPSLSDLVGGITSVTLGDEEAKRRGVQKSVLEREFPPTFDVAIELASRDQWRIHLDVSQAVDNLLLGREANAEVRERDKDGRIWAWPEDESTDSEDEQQQYEGDNAKKSAKKLGIQIQTQPFPEVALAAARKEFVLGAGDSSSSRRKNDLKVKEKSAEMVGAEIEKLATSVMKSTRNTEKSSQKATKEQEDAASIKIYLYGVDPESVLSTADALNKSGSLAIAGQVQDADAILATRPKLRSSGWLRNAAQAAGIPVFSIRSSSVEHVVKAIRTLTGVDPSPGGIFSRISKGNEEISPEADPRVASSPRVLRAETSIALVNQQQQNVPDNKAATESIAEAKAAIESIVLQLDQPVELKPASDAQTLDLQASVARGYGLASEKVGGNRLRILPRGWTD